MVSRFASVNNLKQLLEKTFVQAIDKISADKAEKNAAQSTEVALADYIAGAKLFRRFALLPQRYSGREVVLRIRMDGQFGTWKMRDEFFTAFGFDPGDTLFGNDATVIGINMDDLDERARTIDFFAGSENADWILDNEITTGTIFEGKFKFAYEQVEGVVSRSYGDTAASIAALILIEGKTVIGKEAGFRKAKSIRSEFYG